MIINAKLPNEKVNFIFMLLPINVLLSEAHQLPSGRGGGVQVPATAPGAAGGVASPPVPPAGAAGGVVA